MSANAKQAYRHTFDGEKFFYYHAFCIEQSPRDEKQVALEESTTLEIVLLEQVPTNASCDFCYAQVHGDPYRGEPALEQRLQVERERSHAALEAYEQEVEEAHKRDWETKMTRADELPTVTNCEVCFSRPATKVVKFITTTGNSYRYCETCYSAFPLLRHEKQRKYPARVGSDGEKEHTQ